jgi:alkanesulfonate monooxygenase SsuD/methylene tetrahydromethanopterin reductase-like flavin-dependent oxidoreductase (luciferase family)
MWKAWKAGDRKAALEAIPDQVIDDLVLHGSPAEVKAKVRRYMDNGVTTVALALVSFGLDLRQTVRELAPKS